MKNRSLLKHLPLFIVMSILESSAQPVAESMMEFGNPSRRINIVRVADGYTAAQKGYFNNICRALFAKMRVIKPFNDYIQYMNLYKVWGASAETGISTSTLAVNNFWGTKEMGGGGCCIATRSDSLKRFLDREIPQWTVAS